MATQIYGYGDDLIYFAGDLSGEVERAPGEGPTLIACSDGTVLEVEYGKGLLEIWAVRLVRAGDLFERIDVCEDEDAERYSDTAHFRDGLCSARVTLEWDYVGK